MITPIILSGGNGTRIWPLSRSHYPKQYLSLLDTQHTLFQETVLRVTCNKFSPPMIICNNDHRFLVAEQLQLINIIPSHIILETEAKNTAPAIAIACLLQPDPEQLLLVLPADHTIENLENFYQAIEAAQLNALDNQIITFGIKPSNPEVNYGYIQLGQQLSNNKALYQVASFIEKPNIDIAKKIFNSDQYYWNSGILLFKASSMLKELKLLQPKLLASCKNTLDLATQDLDFLRLNSELIYSIPNNSIDYAVMEHTKKAVVMPVDLTWSDLGSFYALWNISKKDIYNNVIIGDVIIKNTNNSYIRTENQLISVIGLSNIIVVATTDAILISSKDQINHIKELVQQLKDQNRTEFYTHKKVYRPWGYYQTIDLADRFQVKKIMIKPGAKISNQIHYHRSEHWVVVKGTAKITKGEEILLLHENESIYLPMGMKHRVENPGKIALHLIEVQSGSYLGEDDIVRIEDEYGRF